MKEGVGLGWGGAGGAGGAGRGIGWRGRWTGWGVVTNSGAKVGCS